MISVVIAAFNEEQSISSLCQGIGDALRTCDQDWEILIINDGSTDGTWPAIAAAARADPRLRGIRLRKNRGKAFALRLGFAEAKGDFIVTMDADLQDDPEGIPGLVGQLAVGFDMVVGWRSPRSDVWHKRLYSAFYNATLHRLTGLHLHDHNCGLKALTRETAQSLTLYGDFHRFMTVIAFAEGFRVGERKTRHRPRQFGRSKYNLTRVFTAPMDLLSLLFLLRYHQRPLRLLGSFGAVMAATGLALLAYLAVLWCAGQGIGRRPLLIYATALLLSGIQLLSLGVVAELIVWTSEGRARLDPASAVADRIPA